LLLGGAIGVKRTLRAGRGRVWAPRMLGLYGLGLIGAGTSRLTRHLAFLQGRRSPA
jgi:hypothetical protein